jgi:MoaA/NifB/PqqE/SkfB family radical SAM enzyme
LPAQINDLPYSMGELRQPGSWHIGSNSLLRKIDKVTANNPEVSIAGALTDRRDRCPFAERGDLVLRWDGEISPCLPLLRDHVTYIGSWEHKQYSYSLGNILNHSLKEVWADARATQLRDRLLEREFSPCLSCRDCWFSDDNRQYCQGFDHPTCGGCLWTEGLIDCP